MASGRLTDDGLDGHVRNLQPEVMLDSGSDGTKAGPFGIQPTDHSDRPLLSWLFLELAIAANDEAELTRAPEMSTPPALVSLYLTIRSAMRPR